MLSTHQTILVVFLVCISINLSQIKATSDPKDSTQHQDHEVPGEPFSPADFRNAEKITDTTGSSSSEDPIEKAGLFEGDIQISNGDNDQVSSQRNAVTDPRRKWPYGIIPYLISAIFSEQERAIIARAILEFHRQTCISFKPRNNENDYVMFSKGEGCSSSVGRVGGAQLVTLGEGCVFPGVVMHELIHAIGFWHEQSRLDRDDHITVLFENIQPGMEENFRKVSRGDAQNLNLPYDTSSLMHYGPYAFSKNRQKQQKTILPKINNDRMGQRSNFSEIDVLKIDKLYNCRKTSNDSQTTPRPQTTTTPEFQTTTTAKPDNNQRCVDNHKHCKQWAENGECKSNPEWMKANCKVSCDTCKDACSNGNKNCDAWASNGECSKNPEYMHTHCAKACKRC